MPIPDADDAVVPSDKVARYLLDENHPIGWTKAVWFIRHEYDPSNPEALIDDRNRSQCGMELDVVGRDQAHFSALALRKWKRLWPKNEPDPDL